MAPGKKEDRRNSPAKAHVDIDNANRVYRPGDHQEDENARRDKYLDRG
jgi:hypothetical protein